MVAKESRFVDHAQSPKSERAFHANFMRTQKRASEAADQFNDAMDGLQYHFAKEHKGWFDRLPRIEFVDPLLVEVLDRNDKKHILIEQFLEGEYEKFNNNMGFVKGKSQQVELRQGQALAQSNADAGLGVIQEESDEENHSVDEEHDLQESAPVPGRYRHVENHLFAQAFSHFSFVKSKRSFMVVDLQGVPEIKSDGTRKFVLTGPAIHKKNSKGRRGKRDFGRPDRGKNGMRAFFRTHSCSDACRLLGFKQVDSQTLEYL